MEQSSNDSEGSHEAVASPSLRTPRRFFSLEQKLEIIESTLASVNSKERSIKAMARQHGLQPGQLRRWMKQLPAIKTVVDQTEKHQSKSTLHRGRPSSFTKEDELISWVLSLRQNGIPVTMNLVILQASELDAVLCHKDPMTKYSVIRRLLRRNNIVIRSKTHESQRPRKEVEAKVLELSNNNALV